MARIDVAKGLDLGRAVIPFGYRFFAAKYLAMARRDRRAWSALRQAAARMGHLAMLQSAWMLDEVMAPGWRQVAHRGPLFILGHQRSGTTLLHRLLASDVEQVAALTLQEMLLPAASLQAGVRALSRLDQRAGGRGHHAFAHLQERLFSPLDDLHRLRLDEVEEDEFVLFGIFASGMCANDGPDAVDNRALDPLRDFDSWPAQRQEAVFDYYRACLLKLAARHPADSPLLVAKNPAFSQKIPALVRAFPEGFHLYLVRNPLEAIPSRLKLIRGIWRRRFPGFDTMGPAHARVILEDSLRTYLYAERDLPGLPADRRLVMRYEDLVDDPAGSLRRIYGVFDVAANPPAAVIDGLERQQGRARALSQERRTSLAEFGLDETLVRRRLAPVLDRHGFT